MKVTFRCKKCGLESEIDDTAKKFECPYCNKLVYYKDPCVMHDAKQNVINNWRFIGFTYLGINLFLFILAIIFWNITKQTELDVKTLVPVTEPAYETTHPLRLMAVNLFLYIINSLIFSHWWEHLILIKKEEISTNYLLSLNQDRKWRLIRTFMLSGLIGIAPLLIFENKLTEAFPKLADTVKMYEKKKTNKEPQLPAKTEPEPIDDVEEAIDDDDDTED